MVNGEKGGRLCGREVDGFVIVLVHKVSKGVFIAKLIIRCYVLRCPSTHYLRHEVQTLGPSVLLVSALLLSHSLVLRGRELRRRFLHLHAKEDHHDMLGLGCGDECHSRARLHRPYARRHSLGPLDLMWRDFGKGIR